MPIGEMIRDARKKAGLSQRDLAARIKKEDGIPISLPYLNDIERDRRNPPGPHLLRQFAAVLVSLPKTASAGARRAEHLS